MANYIQTAGGWNIFICDAQLCHGPTNRHSYGEAKLDIEIRRGIVPVECGSH